ncbi:unnamed protein product, partial [Larinioides sclopetarius]
MVTTKMSASFFALILVGLIERNSEAAPVRDYDGVPSGILHPISGTVPISVPRRRPNAADKILKAIRARVDKNHASDLDSSIRNDIMIDALAPPECFDKYGIRDGVLKHTIRGTRDVIGAIIQDIQGLGQGILKNLPLVPHVINGIAEAVTTVLCGAEDAVSDVISGFDDGPN